MRWHRLVLATGAAPRRLPMVPPAANVHHLRGLGDARRLAGDLAGGGRLVVIGAGFVGAEVASSARALGVEVTIVEALPVPFAATLGPSMGRRLAALYRSHGVDLRLGRGVGGVTVRDGRAASVELADGTVIECSSVLVAVGTRPSAGLVEGLLELAPDGGVPTDALGATAAPGVFACGDVASPWRPELGAHRRLEHWTAASTGGAAVARAITGRPSPPSPPPYFWSDQFGWRLQMVGHAAPGADARTEELLRRRRASSARASLVRLGVSRHDRRWTRYEKPLPGHQVQVDVTFIEPIAGVTDRRFYQCTAIDDCTRLRVLQIFPKKNRQTAIALIDYLLARLSFPVKAIQTDNGSEFQSGFHWHLLDRGIRHVYITSATPRLDGKVERSHRTDAEEFYRLEGVVIDDSELFNDRLREAGAAPSPNGLPSESRQIAQRSPGWITSPPSSTTRARAAGRSGTVR